MRKGLSGEAEAAPADWRVLRRLWPYVRRNRGRVSLALLLLALAKAATLTTPYLLKLLVDGLSAQPPDLRLPFALAGLLFAALVLGLSCVRSRKPARVAFSVLANAYSLITGLAGLSEMPITCTPWDLATSTASTTSRR